MGQYAQRYRSKKLVELFVALSPVFEETCNRRRKKAAMRAASAIFLAACNYSRAFP